MARIYSPLGTITGSVGNLTFSGKAGDNQLRQKIASNSSNTPAQQDTRARFKFLASLYGKVSSVVTRGLKKLGNQSPYNRFVSQNFSITSYDADDMVTTIDYSSISLSAGSLEGVMGLAGTKTNQAATTVSVSFTDNSGDGMGTNAGASDIVTVALVSSYDNTVYATEEVTRTSGAATITDNRLAGVAASDLVVYAFARRADGSNTSNTAFDDVS